jgi:hypothetical protein
MIPSYCDDSLASRTEPAKMTRPDRPTVASRLAARTRTQHRRGSARGHPTSAPPGAVRSAGSSPVSMAPKPTTTPGPARTAVEVLAQTGRRDAASCRGGTYLVLVALSTQQRSDVQACLEEHGGGQYAWPPCIKRLGAIRPHRKVASAVTFRDWPPASVRVPEPPIWRHRWSSGRPSEVHPSCRSVARCLPGSPVLGVASQFLGAGDRSLSQRPA